MKTIKILTQLIIFTLIYGATGFCNVTLIKSEFYKDGGTRCVEYNKDDNFVKCCIDGRLMAGDAAGTRDVFIGGYPGDDKSKIITREEMKAVYDDIAEIMLSDEYKRYAAMTRDDMRALVVITDHKLDEQKMKEHKKASSYRSLSSFKRDLFIRLLLFNWYLWACVFFIASFYLYRRIRSKTHQNK